MRVAGSSRPRLWLTLCAAALLAGWPSVAAAHVGGPAPSDAPYYETVLTGIAPVPAGVSAQVAANGDWIELAVTGPAEVIVNGYGGEPYLRLTAAGVWQNDVSTTSHLNQSLFVDTAALDGIPASAAPVWRRTSTAGTARWHDHRIHWMGVGRPPAVAADPSRPHLIGTWTIPARAGSERFKVKGTLNWIGKPKQIMGFPIGTAVALFMSTGILMLITLAVTRTGRRLGANEPKSGSAR